MVKTLYSIFTDSSLFLVCYNPLPWPHEPVSKQEIIISTSVGFHYFVILFFSLQVAKAVSQALNRCVNCLPGQRDVDNAIRTVGEASKKLLADSVSDSQE